MKSGSNSSYLFGDSLTIADLIENQRRETERALYEATFSESELESIEIVEEKLFEKYRLDCPVLDRSKTVEFPIRETDIDVTNDPQRAIFDRSQKHFIKGHVASIGVPFAGEAILFRFNISPYNGPIEGKVDGRVLILEYRGEHLDSEVISREFNSRLERIENMLRMIQGQTEGWNLDLKRLVKSRVNDRVTKLSQAKAFTMGFPAATLKSKIDSKRDSSHQQSYDLFISHASEDKTSVAKPLYEQLIAAGVSVWYDDAELKLGDSLRRKIDAGLATSRYGVVILSSSFFAKQWPQNELDALVAKETSTGSKAILPVWHGLEKSDVMRFSPLLADRLAARSADGIDAIVRKIMDVVQEN